MNNLLNVVDENGKIIGEDTRENIHKNGLLHQEIHIWFFNDQKEIIFQHRSKSKDMNPNLLDATVGGHVEQGSDYISTALKEASEETGLELKESDLHEIETRNTNFTDPVTQRTNNALRTIFAYKYDGSIDNLKTEIDEGIGFETINLEELKKLNKDEQKRFIPNIVNKAHIKLFEKILEKI